MLSTSPAHFDGIWVLAIICPGRMIVLDGGVACFVTPETVDAFLKPCSAFSGKVGVVITSALPAGQGFGACGLPVFRRRLPAAIAEDGQSLQIELPERNREVSVQARIVRHGPGWRRVSAVGVKGI